MSVGIVDDMDDYTRWDRNLLFQFNLLLRYSGSLLEFPSGVSCICFVIIIGIWERRRLKVGRLKRYIYILKMREGYD